MISKEVRLKRFEEILTITDEGKVIIEGNTSPTDIQIGQAIRKYARQFVQANKINGKTMFRLNRPHPKIGAEKNTSKTKSEWMKEYNMDEQMFDAVRSSGYLMKVA